MTAQQPTRTARNEGRTDHGGFTLIELLVVVAVVAILATIAYPAYMNHIHQSRRSHAQSDLVTLANFMARFYAQHGNYVDTDGEPPVLPFTTTPRDASGNDIHYDLTLAVGDKGRSYVLTATPGNGQREDNCGTLTLDQAGRKTPAGCWP